jgi:hypothetical protein
MCFDNLGGFLQKSAIAQSQMYPMKKGCGAPSASVLARRNWNCTE